MKRERACEPLAQQRKDNLYSPLATDHGAHGRFDAEARSVSWQLRAAQHGGWLALLVAAAALGFWTARRH